VIFVDESSETPVIETETPAVTETPVELITPEQLAEKLAARDAEWQGKLTAKDGEVAEIKSKYDRSTVERCLTDAISHGDAFSTEQVMPLLKPYTSAINGEPVVMIEGFIMTPREAVQWMRSQPERYGNLFKSNVIGGFGGHSTAEGMRGSRPQDIRTLSARDYRRLRTENPRALGFDQ